MVGLVVLYGGFCITKMVGPTWTPRNASNRNNDPIMSNTCESRIPKIRLAIFISSIVARPSVRLLDERAKSSPSQGDQGALSLIMSQKFGQSCPFM
jgi:hypothetical protein